MGIENPRKAQVAVLMGSKSDHPVMLNCIAVLKELGVDHEVMIISAHRTPERLFEFAKCAEEKGYKLIIAGAGGAAHLPGMVASLTTLPVMGVPISMTPLNGIDSMLSMLQMPAGTPVATFSINSPNGKSPGAVNAAIFAAQILSSNDQVLSRKLKAWMGKHRDIPLHVE